ncbi:hypothetical protein NDU88_000111 [Pleurodeles waltl]|uniref:Uncharacterized protein n=1 Tax=Pleurodeles waltl TaxID=8319 RepID=A0AAV7TDZ7_PLEWA|nr:hypothetical protein NDU88_000111 [Pleurodeles waltl]
MRRGAQLETRKRAPPSVYSPTHHWTAAASRDSLSSPLNRLGDADTSQPSVVKMADTDRGEGGVEPETCLGIVPRPAATTGSGVQAPRHQERR